MSCISEIWGSAAPSRHRRDSAPSEKALGGLWCDFEAVRTATVPSTQAIIRTTHGSGGVGHEEFPFIKPVPASGNIEDWLTTLLHYMQLTVKSLCATAGEYCAATGVDIPGLRRFVDDSKAQIALLGIQFMWTADTQTALEVSDSASNVNQFLNLKLRRWRQCDFPTP